LYPFEIGDQVAGGDVDEVRAHPLARRGDLGLDSRTLTRAPARPRAAQ